MKNIVLAFQNIIKPYIDTSDRSAKRAVEANIAPVETDATSASKGYVVGEQLILNDVLYDVTATITAGNALIVDTNISPADDVTSQIANVVGDMATLQTAVNGKASKDVIDTEYEEIGSAALYSHTSGTRFYATDGKIYKASADIAVGDTITVNTNCTLDNIIDALNDTTSDITDLNTGLANEAATRSAMGAKNVFNNLATSGEDSTNGLTYTVNADKSVTVSATSGSYPVTLSANSVFYVATSVNLAVSGMKLSGCPSNGSDSSYSLNARYIDNTWADREYGNGIILANNINALVIVLYKDYELTAPLTFKPMVRLATDSDSTYQPYSKSNLQLTQDSVTWDNLSEVGAVNYFNNTASSPQTVRGVTYTVDATTKKITATGTNDGTANSYIVVKQNLKAGTYKCSGCPSGGSNSNYRIVWDKNDSQNNYDYGDGVIIILATDGHVTAYFNIMKDYAISGSVVFEPMITPVEYNGPYVPYAKTNKELTDELTTAHSGILTVDSNNADLQWNYGSASANDFAMNFKGFIQTKRDATSGENSWINIGTVSKKPKASQQIACPRQNNSEGTIVSTIISIDSNGNVLFNMRDGMKNGDQFTTAGAILL